MPLPRFFVASGDGAAVREAPSSVVHAIDTFVIGGRASAREWVVGPADDGQLTAQPADPRWGLRPSVQAELAFHETSGQRCRAVAVQSLYLFELQLLAHAPDLPGVNDPLYLHGQLIGPLAPSGNHPLARRTGKLVVTRGDVLHGLVASAAEAFAHPDTVIRKATRSYHLLVPGDREEVLREGHGAVLAYPVSGVEPALAGPGNEALVDEILYRVLKAVWKDVMLEDPRPIRDPDLLPVPSRAAHEVSLVSAGFKIKGDHAVRKRKGPVGWFVDETRRLPPQGNTEVFLELAEEALRELPGWPPPRIAALNAQVTPGPPGSAAPHPRHAGHEAFVAWRNDWIRRFREAQAREKQAGKGKARKR